MDSNINQKGWARVLFELLVLCVSTEGVPQVFQHVTIYDKEGQIRCLDRRPVPVATAHYLALGGVLDAPGRLGSKPWIESW